MLTVELTYNVLRRVGRAFEYRAQKSGQPFLSFPELLKKWPNTTRLFFQDYITRWINGGHINNTVELRVVERFLQACLLHNTLTPPIAAQSKRRARTKRK